MQRSAVCLWVAIISLCVGAGGLWPCSPVGLWLGVTGGAVLAEEEAEEEVVGKRPYEMDWAQRYEDPRPPLVDFENLDGWTLESQDAVASFGRSREQQIWGRYVGKLTYRGTGKQPRIFLRPSSPISFSGPVDSVNVWVYGNNWGWMPDPSTPQVRLSVHLKSRGGKSVRLELTAVNWKEWFLVHHRLRAEDIGDFQEGGWLEAIEVAGGTNSENRTIYFDNLVPYREPLPPLEFAPRPRRPITLPEGQTPGTNTGPGVLPFPAREETILPDQLTPQYRTEVVRQGQAYRFCYRAADGELIYEYLPKDGHWGDLTATWGQGLRFKPLVEGGIRLRGQDGATVLPKYELLECRQDGETVLSRWRVEAGGTSGEVAYVFRLWQKSLVIDVACRGGIVAEVALGYAQGLPRPQLVTIPYLTGDARRPAVVLAGELPNPIFMMGLVDYYRSNASALFAINELREEKVVFNGGSRYLPKTDGRLNDCFERIFLTVSPRFEEVLPNIANPRSPWMHVTGERVWRAHGASIREKDYALWKQVARHGMTKVAITDHESGWRDGGESFTLRTRAAPGKGGDEGQRWYAQKIQELGFLYGIYNNYTDFAPVNEYWDEDRVTRLSDGEWRRAWPRCYNLKPSRAVELEAKLAPIIQEKFHLSTAYCDVHTAVRPWDYCDFDTRVPGAATFAATFYAYGEIMLHQKATWNGPVYSEGNNHWYYCGLTDGNYAQDQLARLDINPWLVDFDLRKLHPLCCNFGMGNLGMYYPAGWEDLVETTAIDQYYASASWVARRGNVQGTAALDRFLAATLAFGHTGFLVLDGGMKNAFRSYYSVQQIHARYAQATVQDIRYRSAEGRLLTTGEALLSGAYRRSQLYVKYANGLELWVNGHRTEPWEVSEIGITLPPNGWYVRGSFPEGNLVAFSAILEGHRVDYVDGPDYLYANGRGQLTRFPRAICDGQLVLLPQKDNTFELIPLDCKVMAVRLAGKSAQAVGLDEESRGEVGPAEVRFSRGLVHLIPREGAFSYKLVPAAAPPQVLDSPRLDVVPGEVVSIQGATADQWGVPAEAKPGAVIWFSEENRWLDFRTVAPADIDLALGSDGWNVSLRSNLAEAGDFEVRLGQAVQTVRLYPHQWTDVTFPFQPPEKEGLTDVQVSLRWKDAEFAQIWHLQAEHRPAAVVPFPQIEQRLQALRDQAESAVDSGTGAIIDERSTSCGGQQKSGIFMHPPYRGGVGYVAAILSPVTLPQRPATCFRCLVGKGDGSDPGDGILYRVYVIDETGKATPLGEKICREHAWVPWEFDLSAFSGKTIRLKLVADVGPAGNSVGDWGCWGDLRIETKDPVWVCTLTKE